MFNILVTFRDIESLEKNNYGDICQFIRDTCLFTSRDMGYLVPPIQTSKFMINTTSERLKARTFFICRYFSFYEQFKHTQLS